MPELPEVETVRKGLNQLLLGLHIKAVWSDWVKSFPNSHSDVNAFLIGAKVIGVRRRAKVLIIDLDSEYSLIIHLKMTGQLVFVNTKTSSNTENRKQITYNSVPEARFGAGHPNESLIGKLPDKSTRVILSFETDGKITDAPEFNARKKRSAEEAVPEVQRPSTGDSDNAVGQGGARLFFNDQRKFGWMRLMPTIEIENLDFFRKVGPEPLSAEFNEAIFIERLNRRKNSNIKSVLLDQTVIAGIGNIYADESLWGAKIHPSQRVYEIPKSKLRTLFSEIQYVLNLAIEKGGSTDKNYVNAEGKKGSYMSFARVFRRENLPCPRCGNVIIKSKVAGRGTHICPKCQIL